jgi:hypothetical protein
MAAPSDLEQQKDAQICQTTAMPGNEQAQMTQDEAALYVAGTLEVRGDMFSSISAPSHPSHVSPTNFLAK